MKEKIKKFIYSFHQIVSNYVYYSVGFFILLSIISTFYSNLWLLTPITFLIVLASTYWEIKDAIVFSIKLNKFKVGDYVRVTNRYATGYEKAAKVIYIDYKNKLITIEFFEFLFRNSGYTCDGLGVAGRCGRADPNSIELIEFYGEEEEDEEEFEDED